MRAAYICADPGVPIFGCKGSSVHVQEVIQALEKRGLKIHLLASNLEGDHRNLEHAEAHPLPSVSRPEVAARELAALENNRHTYRILRRNEPFDLVYERFSLWSYGGMEYARKRGVPGFLEVNAPLIEEQARHRTLVNKGLAEQAARRAFRAAEKILAVSRQVAAWLEGYLEESKDVHVVPNGVDATRFCPGLIPAMPAGAGTFTLGFVGTLKPWHDLETLAAAFERLHQQNANTRLLVVGDGPRRSYLKERFKRSGIADSAHFVGAVPPADVPAWLASMDVALALYSDGERCYFSPLKVYEYMAAGLPVVASRSGQLQELIEDGKNGFLCAPGDTAAVVSALERLLENPHLRAAMGRFGRTLVCRHHTWDAVAARILELAGSRRHAAATARGLTC